MAKAIFTRDFHWGRPQNAIGFFAAAKPEPQSFPADFIEAAIKAGVAVSVKRPPRKTKPKD